MDKNKFQRNASADTSKDNTTKLGTVKQSLLYISSINRWSIPRQVQLMQPLDELEQTKDEAKCASQSTLSIKQKQLNQKQTLCSFI